MGINNEPIMCRVFRISPSLHDRIIVQRGFNFKHVQRGATYLVGGQGLNDGVGIDATATGAGVALTVRRLTGRTRGEWGRSRRIESSTVR